MKEEEWWRGANGYLEWKQKRKEEGEVEEKKAEVEVSEDYER